MGSFGSSAPGHLSLIYLKGMGDGAIPTVDLLGGEIYVKKLQVNRRAGMPIKDCA
jgi:hypothetical protein